jgi:hypothetical protein
MIENSNMIFFFLNLNPPYLAKDMPENENGIEINIIIILGKLSTVVEDPLEKEIRKIIIILI